MLSQASWEDPVGVATVSAVVRDLDLDLELVERHRYGDDRAFNEVYARFEDMVYNLSYRLAGNREEAADLTQEIFLRVFRHLGSFGGRSTLKTWIFRIAVNHCRDRLSRWHPPTQPIGEESGEGIAVYADPSRGPGELAGAAGGRRGVARALRRRPQGVGEDQVRARDLVEPPARDVLDLVRELQAGDEGVLEPPGVEPEGEIGLLGEVVVLLVALGVPAWDRDRGERGARGRGDDVHTEHVACRHLNSYAVRGFLEFLENHGFGH